MTHTHTRYHLGRAPPGYKCSTWVVVEDDVEEVLVSPGDVILVLLVKRVQQILPGQASRDHAVLEHQRCLAACALIKGTSSKQHLHFQPWVAISRRLKRRRAAKLSSEGQATAIRGAQSGPTHSGRPSEQRRSLHASNELTLNAARRILVRFISMTPELTPVTP